MASRVCWRCRVSAHQAVWGEPTKLPGTDVWFLAFNCDECGALSLAETRNDTGTTHVAKSHMSQPGAVLTWHPASALGKDFPDVPDHIAAAASEAHTCHSVNAYRAAILMARAVVEAIAKDKGATEGQLAAKIGAMEKAGLIRELVKDTAHETRFLGNGMAHGDFVAGVDEGDWADVLALMDELLDEVYQAPARVNARRTERAARKAAAKVEGSDSPQ